MSLPLWKPDAARAAASNMAGFAREAARHRHVDAPPGAGLRIGDYDQLWRWSVSQPARFWQLVWQFCQVRASRPAEQVLA
ncbi:MAG: acetoacetate--CoA ligase, partial [Nevskiaceae bacterium]